MTTAMHYTHIVHKLRAGNYIWQLGVYSQSPVLNVNKNEQHWNWALSFSMLRNLSLNCFGAKIYWLKRENNNNINHDKLFVKSKDKIKIQSQRRLTPSKSSTPICAKPKPARLLSAYADVLTSRTTSFDVPPSYWSRPAPPVFTLSQWTRRIGVDTDCKHGSAERRRRQCCQLLPVFLEKYT